MFQRLLAAFILVPLIELMLLIQVAKHTSFLTTIMLVIITESSVRGLLVGEDHDLVSISVGLVRRQGAKQRNTGWADDCFCGSTITHSRITH